MIVLVSAPPVIEIHIGDVATQTPASNRMTLAVRD
jgi:hypothetical protein